VATNTLFRVNEAFCDINMHGAYRQLSMKRKNAHRKQMIFALIFASSLAVLNDIVERKE
jgi:hypothetical protein